MHFWQHTSTTPQTNRKKKAMRKIEILLIRHGESESNIQFKIFLESITSCLLLRNYSFQNFLLFLNSIFNLTLNYQYNSTLSDLGIQQVTSSLSPSYFLSLLFFSLTHKMKMKSRQLILRIIYKHS